MSDEIDLAGPKKKRKKMADTVQIHGDAMRSEKILVRRGQRKTQRREADPILMLVIW